MTAWSRLQTAARALRGRRSLFALLTAESVSMLGSRMTFVALPWLVLSTTGSPVKTGLVAAAEMLPYVLANAFGAPLVNRLGTRRVGIVADVASALTLGGVAFVYRGGLPLLLLLVALTGALRGIGDNAKKVLLRYVVEDTGTNMLRVTTVYDGITRLSTMLGAPLGGVIVYAVGPLHTVALDAASFAASALLMIFLVRSPAESADAEKSRATTEPYFTALRNGFSYLRQDRLVMGMIVMLFFTNMFTQASSGVFVPLWVRDVLHSPAGLGLLAGAFATGALLGNIVFAAIGPKLPRYATLVVGYLIGGSPRFLSLALSDRIAVVMTVSFVAGMALSSANPIIGALMFERVPPDMLARVGGLATAVAWAGIPLGAVLGGWTVEAFDLTTALLLTAGLYLAATLIPVINQRTWRTMNTKPATAPASGSDSGPDGKPGNETETATATA